MVHGVCGLKTVNYFVDCLPKDQRREAWGRGATEAQKWSSFEFAAGSPGKKTLPTFPTAERGPTDARETGALWTRCGKGPCLRGGPAGQHGHYHHQYHHSNRKPSYTLIFNAFLFVSNQLHALRQGQAPGATSRFFGRRSNCRAAQSQGLGPLQGVHGQSRQLEESV